MNTTSSHPAPVAGIAWQPRADAFGNDLPQFLALVAEVCESVTAAVTLAGSCEVQVCAAHGSTRLLRQPHAGELHDMLTASGRPTVIADLAAAGLGEAGFAAAAPLHRGTSIVGALCVFGIKPYPGDIESLLRRLTGMAHRLDVEAALRASARYNLAAELRETYGEDVITAVGHEIRTPLAVIQGHLELLCDGGEAQGWRHRWQVDAINRNILRLCETVDRLLLTPQPPLTNDRSWRDFGPEQAGIGALLLSDRRTETH
uniref:histidine kinase dimerization/phospho-acceptor domain-containing protein n=1 Tax=Paractinoplanes polyasparticus TaxID=2856853 RepID=UPI001C84B817|nr:histidine kinase dimerization/phospho-acceptor domain-containing protein [Actinoplanes polyasparticus]